MDVTDSTAMPEDNLTVTDTGPTIPSDRYQTPGQSLSVYVVRSIMIYSPLVIWIFGTLGSVLSFLVLSRPTYRASVSTFILKSLCVVNFCRIQLLIFEWLLTILNIDLMSVNIQFCRVLRYITLCWQTASSWTLVILAIGRTLAVYKPLYYKVMFSFKKVRLSLFIAYLFIAICYCPALYTFKTVTWFDPILGKRQTVCKRLNQDYYIFTYIVLPWMDLILYCVLPFIILSATSVIIIKQMYHEHLNRANLTQNSIKSNTNINSLLIGNSVAFVILTSPFCFFYLYNYFTDIYVSFQKFVNSLMLIQIGLFFRNLNQASMFYTYVISGARFRLELKLMCKSLFTRSSSSNELSAATVTEDLSQRRNCEQETQFNITVDTV